MIEMKGHSIVGGKPCRDGAGEFKSTNPRTGKPLWSFLEATAATVENAAELGWEAFLAARSISARKRAKFLEACVREIESAKPQILAAYLLESALPEERANLEFKRLIQQAILFAGVLREGSFVNAIIDSAFNIRQIRVGRGPVAIFAPANFPLAFSVFGGDTVAAFAAGCPVIFKAHRSHPGTSQLVAEAILRACASEKMPKGWFSLIQGTNRALGGALINHPAIKAGAFTGSHAGGMALYQIATTRPDPIPFYAEMSSANPVVVLPGGIGDPTKFADGYFRSLTMGVGQLCTKPGLMFALRGEAMDTVLEKLDSLVRGFSPATMLNRSICNRFLSGVVNAMGLAYGPPEEDGEVCLANGVLRVIHGDFSSCGMNQAVPTILVVTAKFWEHNDLFLDEEVFGPFGVIVLCDTLEEILERVEDCGGQLTVTLHGSDEELESHLGQALLAGAQMIAGRVKINGWPTGVQVCHAMVHGGPPLTTTIDWTSVGAESIGRFMRAVCFDNCPNAVLPLGLRDENPLGITRRVDGKFVPPPAETWDVEAAAI